MSEDYTDIFEIINGPEDGVSFPVIRTPVNLGASTDCGIFINFDKHILPVHARVTVVSGGYRIRSISGDPVYINEKRSGIVRARIARSGDIICVGHTSSCLVCAPDGLAKRSFGMPTESNTIWLLHVLADKGIKAALMLYRLIFRALSRICRLGPGIVILVICLSWFQPDLLRSGIYFVRGWGYFFYRRISEFVSTLM